MSNIALEVSPLYLRQRGLGKDLNNNLQLNVEQMNKQQSKTFMEDRFLYSGGTDFF